MMQAEHALGYRAPERLERRGVAALLVGAGALAGACARPSRPPAPRPLVGRRTEPRANRVVQTYAHTVREVLVAFDDTEHRSDPGRGARRGRTAALNAARDGSLRSASRARVGPGRRQRRGGSGSSSSTRRDEPVVTPACQGQLPAEEETIAIVSDDVLPRNTARRDVVDALRRQDATRGPWHAANLSRDTRNAHRRIRPRPEGTCPGACPSDMSVSGVVGACQRSGNTLQRTVRKGHVPGLSLGHVRED